MKNLISQGIARKLIRLEDNDKYIVYTDQNKRRNSDNPEEKVQAEAFLSLVLDYKYPPGQVRSSSGWSPCFRGSSMWRTTFMQTSVWQLP